MTKHWNLEFEFDYNSSRNGQKSDCRPIYYIPMREMLHIGLYIFVIAPLYASSAPPGSGWSALVLSYRCRGNRRLCDDAHGPVENLISKANNLTRGVDDCGFVFAIEEREHDLNALTSGPSMESYRFMRVGDSTFVLCSGLQSDVIALREELQKQLLDIEHVDIDAIGVSKIISNVLYKNRLHVSPIVAGPVGGAPYIASMDSRGALAQSLGYEATGAVKEPLMNLCETLYREDMGLDAAADLARRCFESALARDVGSSGGAEQRRRPRVFALQHGILWAKNRSHEII
jgi:hypothetical protein